MFSFKVAIVVLVACVVANAEPPRFRSNRFQFQRQEQDPATDAQEGSGSDAPYPPAASAPYPPAMPQAPYAPSGWKPSGRLFALPARQTELPKDTYGPPPPQTYGPPPQTYGPPPTPTEQPAETEQPTTTTEAEVEEGTTEESVTDEPLSENVDVDDKAQEQPQSERLTQQQQGGPGFYYVQLPQLQQQQQQQIYLAPQVQSAALKALPAVAQPVVYAPQPLQYVSQYYVSSQSW